MQRDANKNKQYEKRKAFCVFTQPYDALLLPGMWTKHYESYERVKWSMCCVKWTKSLEIGWFVEFSLTNFYEKIQYQSFLWKQQR